MEKKKPDYKVYMLYDSNCMKIWKRQNYGDRGRNSGGQSLGGCRAEGWIDWAQRLLRAVKVLCRMPQWWVHVIMYLSKPLERTPSRANPNVNEGLWLMMLHQGKLTDCSSCTYHSGGGNVDSVRLVCGWGTGRKWEFSHFPQFCCKPKTDLQINSFLKNVMNLAHWIFTNI